MHLGGLKSTPKREKQFIWGTASPFHRTFVHARSHLEAEFHDGFISTDTLKILIDMLNLVITGQTRYGTTVYNIDGKWIRRGISCCNEIAYTIDGNWIRKGQDPWGEIVYTIDGHWIREGQSPYGDILYNIDGNWIRKGQDPNGDIIYSLH